MLKANNSIPLYEQLQAIIRDNILSGMYAPGERMPSEPELGKSFGVSRITVRRAIEELEKGGLLERKQGRGTFVRYNKVRGTMDSIMGFTDSLSGMGLNPRRVIHSKYIVPADAGIASTLCILRGAPVVELKRTMCDDTKPILYDECYYPLERFPGMLEKLHEDVSTYQLIREEYGVLMTRAHKCFNVEIADEEICKYLNCKLGDPLFSIFKVAYDEEDVPVHISKSRVLADCATYVLDVDQNRRSSSLHLQVHKPGQDAFIMPTLQMPSEDSIWQI